jgi:cytoplasmic iron level regulating protein YaaA (DUF328/UPF0246 family)
MNEIQISKKQEKLIKTTIKDTNEIIDILENLEIDNLDSLNTISELSIEYNKKLKEIEGSKKYILDPLNMTRKRINEVFNPCINTLKNCIKICKDKILDYQTKTMLEYVDQKNNNTQIIPVELPKKNIQKRTKLSWRIIDFNKIPRKYLNIDRSAIQIEFRKKGLEMNIPGIEIYEEDTLAIYN